MICWEQSIRISCDLNRGYNYAKSVFTDYPFCYLFPFRVFVLSCFRD